MPEKCFNCDKTDAQKLVGTKAGYLCEACIETMYDIVCPTHIEVLVRAKMGECLRRVRELRVVTMGDVARALDVTVTQVSNWELDREPMTDEQQKRYVSAIFADAEHATLEPNARIDELLERNTQLVFELRDVDRERMVREFHTAVVGHTLPERPEIPPEAILRRQLRLITEEYLELMEAAYDKAQISDARQNLLVARQRLEEMVDRDCLHVNFPEMLDATIDLDYVVEGLRAWCGIRSRPAWALVHAANMAKAGGPKRESDGKMLKPPGWKPPDLAAEIERQKAAATARERGPK